MKSQRTPDVHARSQCEVGHPNILNQRTLFFFHLSLLFPKPQKQLVPLLTRIALTPSFPSCSSLPFPPLAGPPPRSPPPTS